MRIACCASLLVWASLLGICQARPPTEEYVRDLRSSALSVREHAATSLGRLGDRSAVPALIQALKDPEKDVRREAAKALGSLKDPRAVTPLLEALRDSDMNVRLYAAYALGEIKDSKATRALLQALRDPAWCVRDQAAWALREIGDPTMAAPLVAALKEKNADAAHIVWVLRHVGGTRAISQLATLLRAPDAEARMRAVRVLGELQDKRVVVPLIAALKDGNPSVRRSAVKALLELGDDRAQQPLKELVTREQDPSVREAAEKAALQLSRHESLVAHWSFDDRNTETARDVTGRGTDGQIHGCTPVKGKVGYALSFSKGRYIELGKPSGLPLAQKPLTIMAWVKSDARNGVVVARGGAFSGFSLYIKDGVPKFGIHRVEDGPTYIAAGRQEVVGSWAHLAGVIKNDRIELYVNAKLAATTKTKGYIPNNCGQGMEIGFDVSNSPAEITDHFEGIIDEVKVFDAALSEGEILKQRRSEQ